MRIAVIDGQGGGIGRVIVEKLRKALPKDDVEIIALGTNAMAAALMLKAGANDAASGENAVIYNADKVDIIVGTIAVLMPHSMLGEFTPAMAEAVAKSPARKILLHLNRSNVEIVGVVAEPLPHLIDFLVERVKTIMAARCAGKG
ncbi:MULTISPECIES: DUF3842 family protein [Desulfofundulus]|uniref:DUF3842 family protein n=3 Tax=Desulfofundulus TaxID=2282741 RepID=A0A494X0A2_9FIRM|nr:MULTISPECIES: DUF3842 family protein [Desulfofundulus]MDQ0286889.1 NAD(P)-dependent dehydrogenase (short-subunit alcohol dehydrogenase family) [Desulfofundulus luciae]MQL51918.1 DUF3842 family protein [Desulfofundulus thermobenzoicus]NHM27606.1 DUF3842 family protein [Desulfofundulus sp. TPOSR]RKO66565.1 DUF3842 family protein [Desulfofundulus salinum]